MVPLVAKIKDQASRDGYATKLAFWSGWQDEAMVVRRVRESAGAPVVEKRRGRPRPADPNQNALAVEVDGPQRPPRNDPRLWVQREALKAALQVPQLAGPYYDSSVPKEAFTHPAYRELYEALLAVGGTSSGLSGPALVDAATQACPHQTVRSLVTELAVEALHHNADPDAKYVGSLIAALQETVVANQIAELKSRLQRLSPVEDADNYRTLFGDLVALEQYRKALGNQAAGGLS
jgi:DNA primase